MTDVKKSEKRGGSFLRKIALGTSHQVVGGIVVILLVTGFGTAGKPIWSAATGHDDDSREFLAEVAWTADVKGQNAAETDLRSFTTPYSDEVPRCP